MMANASYTALEPTPIMDDLSYTTIIKLAEPLARRRGSAFYVRRRPRIENTN
jgi:hypothetical protein